MTQNVVSIAWTFIVLIAIVAMFVCIIKFGEKRAIVFLTIAILLVTIGLTLKTYSINAIAESFKDSMPVLVMIVALEIFSLGVIASKFPKWLMGAVLGLKYVIYIQFLFIFMAYFLSLWINNLAAMLVILPFALTVADSLDFKQEAFLPALVIASNLGGASTMIGDFPNIVISQYAKVTFSDFFVYLGLPIIFLLLGLCLVYYLLIKKTKGMYETPRAIFRWISVKRYHGKWGIEKLNPYMVGVSLLFLAMIITFIKIKMQTELERSVLPALITIIFAVVILLIFTLSGNEMFKTDSIFKKLDFSILVWFASLFIISGALKSTNLLQNLASYLSNNYASSPILISSCILFVSALSTSFLSAGPSAALLLPLALELSKIPSLNPTIWWVLSLGILAGSSSTPIGATAGPVTMSRYEEFYSKEGRKFSFLSFLKIGIPCAALFLLLSFLYIYFFLIG